MSANGHVQLPPDHPLVVTLRRQKDHIKRLKVLPRQLGEKIDRLRAERDRAEAARLGLLATRAQLARERSEDGLRIETLRTECFRLRTERDGARRDRRELAAENESLRRKLRMARPLQ